MPISRLVCKLMPGPSLTGGVSFSELLVAWLVAQPVSHSKAISPQSLSDFIGIGFSIGVAWRTLRGVARLGIESVGRCDDGGLFAAQERVDLALGLNAGGQGRLVVPAQFLASGLVGHELWVVRLHFHRKFQVAQRVFMGAAAPRGAGRGRQALQGCLHLCRGAFKQPPAAAAEQGVAAKQQWGFGGNFRKIGNMACRVAGHIQHLEIQAQQ